MINIKKPNFQAPLFFLRLIFENNPEHFAEWAIILNPKKIFVLGLPNLIDEKFTRCLRNLLRLKHLAGILLPGLSIYELLRNWNRFVLLKPEFQVRLCCMPAKYNEFASMHLH